MLINAYDTTVGKQYKIIDKVENTIKTLHITRNLIPSNKEDVFYVDNSLTLPIPIFAFPITMQAHNRKTITVYDERPFRNKNNQITQLNELTILKLTAYLQQDVAEGNLTPLKGGRQLATKAFSEAVGTRMIRRGGLDVNESLTLKVLLAYYFVCLEETSDDGLELVSTNIIRSIYGTEKGYILGVVGELPKLTTLEDLLIAIQTNPTLFKLKSLDLKDMLSVISGISFSGLGGKIIAASAEAPCLFTAMVYGVIKFKAYNKTPLGMALDPKYNRNILEAFVNHIDFTYNLNG